MPIVPAVKSALEALAMSTPAYTEAQLMYDGTAPEVMASERLRELIGRDTGYAFRINYARTPVDVLVERTMIQSFTCKDQAQQKTVMQAWDDNELGIEAKDVHRRAYEYGDAFLIGWPDEDMLSNVAAYCHDPTSVRVFYDPAKPRKKTHAVHAWHEEGSAANGLGAGLWHRVNLYYEDRCEQYRSEYPAASTDVRVQSASSAASSYVEHSDEDGAAWPIMYAAEGLPEGVPVFHFRTGRPYGRPEHADAYGPQNGINKLVTSMMANVDFTIGPQRYALTDSALDAKPGSEAPSLFDDEIDETTGLSDDSNMESGPGTVWLLSGRNVRVGQFEAAQMSNFLLPKNDLVKSMAAVTDLPLDRYEPGSGVESGESKRMDEIPLNKKTSDRFAQFGVTWREFALFVLAVNNSGAAVESDIQVSWAPPEVYTDKASWETAALQIAAGVPYEQVLIERGYSPELAAKWAAERANAAATARAAFTPAAKNEEAPDPKAEGLTSAD